MSSELENYIQRNLDELDRKKPDAAVLGRILATMEATRNDKPTAAVISFRLLKWAAACLLVTAGGIAVWYFNKPPQTNHTGTVHIPETRPLPAQKTDPATPSPADVADERMAMSPKVVVRKDKPKKTAFLPGLNNMQSAASRINAVASASRMKNRSNEVVDALVHTLNNDPNANVRLAALEGLTRFHKEEYVRRKLAASLNNQQDPLVQINMIDLLTSMRESSILPDLERIANDDNSNNSVKDVAWSGIQQLRHKKTY